MITKLCSLATAYRTDKAGWYTPFYDLLFCDRSQVRFVLEVGIGTPDVMQHVPGYVRGASLKMWREYFPKAIIVGVDNNPAAVDVVVDYPLFVFCSDSRDPELRKKLSDVDGVESPHFDLVIDDGDHSPEAQWDTFQNLFPLVKPGGYYVIEDAEFWLELSDKLEGYTHQIVLCPFAGAMGKLILIRN